MRRISFLCLTLALAGCAGTPPPGLDPRPENPALATAPESPAARYRPALETSAPADLKPSVEGSVAGDPGMSDKGGMTGMNPAGRPAPANATLYACPMHPEERHSAPGKCPLCGMSLKPVEQDPEGRP